MFATHSLPGVNPGPEYDEGVNSSMTVAVQIESRSGVENVEKIAAVPGIDVLFIGPFDLAKQMGITRGGEEHEQAIQRILAAAHAAGKKAAIFCMFHLILILAVHSKEENPNHDVSCRHRWQRRPSSLEARVRHDFRAHGRWRDPDRDVE